MNDDDTPRPTLPAPTDEDLRELERRRPALKLWIQRQTWLAAEGFDPGGIDGRPGDKTTAAVRAFQEANGIDVDGKWGKQTAAAMARALKLPPPEPTPETDGYLDLLDGAGETLDAEFFECWLDLTAKSNEPDEKGRRQRKGSRSWTAIQRLVWHQTAFTWRPLRVSRLLNKPTLHHQMTAHICIDTDGTLILLHPLDAYLNTANAFNRDCISVEIMGNFEGMLGSGKWYKPEKFGRGRPTRIQLIRARQLTVWLTDPSAHSQMPGALKSWEGATVDAENRLHWVNGHRNATDDRSADPGSEVWYNVVCWTVAQGLLTEGPIAGKGQPTPAQWRAVPVVGPQEMDE